VVTAGGTREPLDPVRYIGNRSSGRMGIAVAEAAVERGAEVTLIAAAVEHPLPDDVEVVRVETTSELRAAVLHAVLGGAGEDAMPPADALVMAAAVADFRPSHPSDTKLVRGDGLTLELEPTVDVLAEIARLAWQVEPRPLLVGFAAETGSLDRAADKLVRKGVDLLVANDVSQPDAGFAVETNRVTVYDREGGADAWPLLSKRAVADRLLDRIVERLDGRDASAHTEPVTAEPHG
jgi:phosphopantothenoylcysteine decarboxylase/phosphopantothenate--cysteine ligase